MSTGTICLLISAGIMIIVTIYLDIVGEQVAEIKEIAEEQGWADPAKVQELGERPRSRAAYRRHGQGAESVSISGASAKNILIEIPPLPFLSCFQYSRTETQKILLFCTDNAPSCGKNRQKRDGFLRRAKGVRFFT